MHHSPLYTSFVVLNRLFVYFRFEKEKKTEIFGMISDNLKTRKEKLAISTRFPIESYDFAKYISSFF